MIEQCSVLAKATEIDKRWKCVDERLPSNFMGECRMRYMIPRMWGGYLITAPDKQELRLGGTSNAVYPERSFNTLDIEYIEEE